MRKFVSIMIVLSSIASSGQNEKISTVAYPKTKKIPVTDDYFGTKVTDDYRWLEDDKSAETMAWVKAQNEVTYGYLNQITFRNKLKARMQQLWNYEKISAPFKEGNFTYYYKNNGLQNQSVLYRKNAVGKEEVFLDPNTFSKDGTSSLGSVDFSKDCSIVAFAISEGESDWRKVIIMDVMTKKTVEQPIIDVKFSGVSCYANEGFYYSSMLVRMGA